MASTTDLPEDPKSLLTLTLTLLRTYWPLLLPALTTLRLLTNRYASPLLKYPGPFLASTTRLWKFLSTASTRTHLDHIALHRTYGPIVRIAPNEVSLSSPEAAREVLAAGRGFHKTDFYAVFPPPENPDIFTETREGVHARKKRVANVPYSMAAMQRLSPFIDDTVELLVRRLEEIAGESMGAEGAEKGKGRLDLGDWLHYFAFDVLGEVAFSRKFGFLEQGTDVGGAIRAIDASQRYNGIVGQVPFLDKLLRRNPLWGVVPGLRTGDAAVTRLAVAEMEGRRPFGEGELGGDGKEGGDGRRDLLDSLIRGHLKDPGAFSEGDVFAVAHGAIFAGSDSTASTMQSFFWHVLSNPPIHAALTAEILSATETGLIPPDGNLSWAQAQSLPYFQACLKEAMRVRPAVGLNITRVVPQGGAEVGGEFFPGGTRVAVNGWVVHRDEETFGGDAGVFRPGRWLEGEERARRMERYMVQFGGGAHVCIGRNLALLEINKVIPRLLRDFELELVDPGRPLEAQATFFVVQRGLEVYIRRRA